MIDMHALIEKAGELAPLPASTLRLVALINRSHYDIGDVVDVVAFDQALTIKLLRAANSAFSARSVAITSVCDAVFWLGGAQVAALAIASNTRAWLQKGIPEYGLAEGELWRHSVAAALAAETSSSFCQVAVPPESFTAALLHDIGKLVMSRFLDPEILRWLRRARVEGSLSDFEAEAQLFQVHHGELGGIMAQRWNLPESIVKGIIYHHTPEQALDVVCDVVNLANVAAKKIEAAVKGQALNLSLSLSVAERLGFEAAGLERLCAEAAKRFKQVSARYNAV